MSLSALPWRRLATASVSGLVALAATLSLGSAPAQADDVVTPGNFTGYGFDQCLAPSQSAMDAWLTSSPFWAVGIYISGDSRYCREQPNLTPRWVRTQLANGWRLLPITLGPQASCTTRERYLQQVRIKPDPKNSYRKARMQGRAEAAEAVRVAGRLGIAKGSTLWYDIEAFDISATHCRESALSFLSAWSRGLHSVGYVSGVYSSAASGIKMMDDARVNRPDRYTLPDQVWIADWNGQADVRSGYVRPDGWMPRARVHQYRGGEPETYGGVTINVDRNWLDLGTGSVPKRRPEHCGGVRVSFPTYPTLEPGDEGALVTAAQCLFRERAGYQGAVNGVYGSRFSKAVLRFREEHGFDPGTRVTPRVWAKLTSQGKTPLMKYGAASDAVRRLQRTLNALDAARVPVTGTFSSTTAAAVKKYQADHKLPQTGVVTDKMWWKLQAAFR